MAAIPHFTPSTSPYLISANHPSSPSNLDIAQEVNSSSKQGAHTGKSGFFHGINQNAKTKAQEAPETIAKIADLSHPETAKKVAQLLSDAFLSEKVNEPFAYYIEPNKEKLQQKLPEHFAALNKYILALGGECETYHDAEGRMLATMTWINPLKHAAVSQTNKDNADAQYEKDIEKI